MRMTTVVNRLLVRHASSVQSANKQNIGRVFFNDEVQKMLKEITRYDDKHIFRRHTGETIKKPQMMFMTDEALAMAKQQAYENAKAEMQMPPVLEPNTEEPKILAHDEAITGYTKNRVVFVDITTRASHRNRFMTIREPNGLLRYPTLEERSRYTHMFYPGQGQIDIPKMFSGEHLEALLKRKEYVYVLDRACVQFEPDDPIYVQVNQRVFRRVNEKKDFEMLRSTRHFGPMCLRLAHDNQIDNLLAYMQSKEQLDDCVKLIKLYYMCHGYELESKFDNPRQVIEEYANNYSRQPHIFKLAMKSTKKKNSKKSARKAKSVDDEEQQV